MKKFVFVLALAAVSTGAHADVVTQWNFNSAVADGNTGTGVITPAIGSGIASLIGGTTSTFASGDASGGSSDPASGDDSGWNLTTFAAQGSGDKTRGAQFAVSTVGFENMVISYDLRHSNTASRYEQCQYSLDGLNFVDYATFDGNAGDTWFNGRTVDLSTVVGTDNNANFAFRVVAAFAPSTSCYLASNLSSTYSTSGTLRFDMVTINAAPVPEAETYAMMLAGLGLVGFIARRRLRK